MAFTKLKQAEVDSICRKHSISPLDYLLSVIDNPAVEMRVKIDAAKAAAPYVHPKLSAVDNTVTHVSHESALDELVAEMEDEEVA